MPGSPYPLPCRDRPVEPHRGVIPHRIEGRDPAPQDLDADRPAAAIRRVEREFGAHPRRMGDTDSTSAPRGEIVTTATVKPGRITATPTTPNPGAVDRGAARRS